jgi:hypothetical protein
MLNDFRADLRFRTGVLATLLALFLFLGPFQPQAAAQCNDSCNAQYGSCGTWCAWIDVYQYTGWNWACQGFCDVWLCGIVVEGLFTEQCDTLCSYDLYNDYCWTYTE